MLHAIIGELLGMLCLCYLNTRSLDRTTPLPHPDSDSLPRCQEYNHMERYTYLVEYNRVNRAVSLWRPMHLKLMLHDVDYILISSIPCCT